MSTSAQRVPSLLSTITAEEKIYHGRRLSTGAMMKKDGLLPPVGCSAGQTVLIKNTSV